MSARLEQPTKGTPTNQLTRSWERRYKNGGTSGAGSRGAHRTRKAVYVDALISREWIESVVDWGCGDGEQLAAMKMIPRAYVGVDVAKTALRRCRRRFPDRRFVLWNLEDPESPVWQLRAELALSMDVLFHLVEDADYEKYLRALFTSASRFVCIHSTNVDRPPRAHMRHRAWLPDALRLYPEWMLREAAVDGEGFFLLEKGLVPSGDLE